MRLIASSDEWVFLNDKPFSQEFKAYDPLSASVCNTHTVTDAHRRSATRHVTTASFLKKTGISQALSTRRKQLTLERSSRTCTRSLTPTQCHTETCVDSTQASSGDIRCSTTLITIGVLSGYSYLLRFVADQRLHRPDIKVRWL